MKNFYFNWIFTLVLSVLVTIPAFSQSGKSLWVKTTLDDASKKELVFRKTEPNKAGFYQLDINALKAKLQAAPNRDTFSGTSNVIIDFPTADGTFEPFRVKEAPIMEEALQYKYPNIRTYIGESINTPGTVIRFSITPQGLHTMSMSNNNGTQFIDPFSKNSNEYIVYNKKDLPVYDEPWICGVVDTLDKKENVSNSTSFQNKNANDGMLRDFRIAIATTIEYSSFHWMAAGLTATDTEVNKRTAVTAAIVVTLARVNFVYERELSITMTLVGNNDSIVFINSDNFSNDDANALIIESQAEIDNIIMPANYDIGHTFSTGGGGLAGQGPCGTFKASGITGSPNPVGDAYDIDFVAHEIGHQFGASHTFNGDAGNCTGSNRSAANAYEPASGSTIMAYAGICAPQNVQGNSDAYFHQRSLIQIWDYVTNGVGQCSAQTATGNSAPISIAGANYIIPTSTPYRLTGSSTDADGIGTHTYTWEQYDLGPAGLPLETNTTGPMVRSFEGTSSSTRVIPRLEDILSAGGVSTTWEKLSSVARIQDFRLTVRDNDTNGGQTAVDDMTVNVNGTAGPFLVTSQNTDQIVWTPGNTETVTWDVAGTTATGANGVNTANVNILLSTDEGVTFNPIVSNIPNNGTYDITVPTVSAPKCRIMVEGAGNIFFNVNDFFFAIGNYTYSTVDVCQDYTFNSGISVPESTTTYSGYVLPIPDSYNITDVNIAVDFTHNNTGDLFYAFRYPDYSGTGVVPLASGVCDGSVDAVFVFDDEAAGAINCGSTGNGDFVTPQSPLSEADNTDSQGDWIFYITDTAVGDGNTATWNSTTITICEQSIQPLLSVDEFNIENSFTVYPNPNNGEFNIKFTSVSNSVKVKVFDVRGRSVFNKAYSNSGVFNESINLGNVQSGLYLLNVNDGGRTITKKIIVE